MKPKRQQDGFTLVELLVVIAIIMVLAALLLPSLRRAKVNAQIVACKSNMRQVGTGLFVYVGDYMKLPLFTNVGNAASNCLRNWAARVPVPGTQWDGLGRLYNAKYVESSKLFFCPGRAANDHGIGDANNAWMCDYAIGWYSGDDISWGGLSGLRLMRRDGTMYSPEGGEWNWDPPWTRDLIKWPSPWWGYPPWYFTFSPRYEQYRDEWLRHAGYGDRTRGGNILVVDARGTYGATPSTVPHNAVANCLMTDGRVVALGNAFGTAMMSTWYYGDGNFIPHHEYGETWWSWAETKLRQ